LRHGTLSGDQILELLNGATASWLRWSEERKLITFSGLRGAVALAGGA
jgi:hypothetical protein